MKTKSYLMVLALLISLGSTGLAEPLGTAFSYQGRLTDGGSPATGLYDMQFVLYDALYGGGQQGAIVPKDDVPVTNGLFTLALDFGPNAFNGQSRWLEVSVRPGASSSFYTPLAPRQPLTPGPYALYSTQAGSAATAASANNFSGALAGDVAGTQAATSVQRVRGVAVASTAPSPNQFLRFDGTQWSPGGVALATDVSGTLGVSKGGTGSGTQNFVDLTTDQTVGGRKLFSPASGPAFSVGNALLVPNLNADLLDGQHGGFYQDAGNLVSGTLPADRIANDSVNGSKLANDSASLSKVTAGNVIVNGINIGIGTAAPTDKLHVAGTARFDIGGGRISITTPGGAPGLIALSPAGNRRDVQFHDWGMTMTANSSASPPASDSGIAILNGGNIGIGTTAPTSKLHVAGTITADRFIATEMTPPGMVLIPAGAFTMGDSIGDGDLYAETPIPVTVSAFYMDVNEVTWSQWQSVYYWAGGHGYAFHAGYGKKANHPVQSVDWYDCVKWCNARSEQAGKTPVYYTDAGLTAVYKTGEVTVYANWTAKGFRLPTEAEWEKAAQGGLSSQRFPWGNVINQNLANYYGSTSAYDLGPNGFNEAFQEALPPNTGPVGYFAANGYGLYDMAGNVSEWCWDWYGTSYEGGSDPRGPTSGSLRVFRGGSWGQLALGCRSGFRNYDTPAFMGFFNGFRSVLPPGQ